MATPGSQLANEARNQQTYNSFSGVDIKITMGGKEIGEMQGISYTITREKAPLYTMGNPNPRSFSRGKRGIAGSLIFLVFDRSNLLESLGPRAYFWADVEDMTYLKQYNVVDPSRLGQMASVKQAGYATPELTASEEMRIGSVARARAWYHDQLLPFDVVLTAINEYGAAARMIVKGVEILNSGSGISIDDITTDENMTFVARDIIMWQSLGFADPTKPESTFVPLAAA